MKGAAFLAPIVLLLAGCGNTPVAPSDAPTTLVSTVTARRGALPATLDCYGTVAPAINGTQSLSVAQPGQVTALLVAPGTAVKAGQSLATFMVAPSARSAYEQASSGLAAARKQAATTAQLLSQQLATQDQLTQANKAVSDAQHALAALQAEGAGQAARTLVAPLDGIVTSISVAQGDRLQAGAPIVTVARAGGVVVTVGVDPAVHGRVAVGMPASLKRLSGGQSLAGQVVRADSALNPLTRLIDVDVSFPAGALLPGEAMQVAIETGQVSGWIVPHQSVVTAGGPARLFQVANRQARAIPIRILLASDRGDVVEGALDPGKPLIVSGAYQVSDGDAVRWSN